MHSPERESIDLDTIRKAYAIFRRDGCINDENSGLGTYFFGHRLDELEEGFRSLGYNGEGLQRGGDFFSGYGNVLWAFDDRVISREKARSQVEGWVEDQRKEKTVRPAFE